MCSTTRFRPPLKCILGRIRSYYSKVKFFGEDIPKEIKYLKRNPVHHGMLHFPVRNCERMISTCHVVKRFRHRKIDEESSDSEDEVESVEDVGKDFKILKIRVNSLRADLILKAALGIARNKVEAAFFQSKVRVNGELPMKKSLQLKVEDEIDLVRGTSKLNPKFLVVSRIKLLSYSQKDEKYTVNAQCFRAITVENYPDHPLKPRE